MLLDILQLKIQLVIPKWFSSWHWYILFACSEVTISLQSRGQGCKTVTDKSAMSKEGGRGEASARGEGYRRLLEEVVVLPPWDTHDIDIVYTHCTLIHLITSNSKTRPGKCNKTQSWKLWHNSKDCDGNSYEKYEQCYEVKEMQTIRFWERPV